MGASQSVVSPDDFKNYLYGTAVIMMAPRLDQSLQFKDCSKIVEEDKNVLPLVLNSTEDQNSVNLAEAYAKYYGNGREEAIDNYVASHILNDQERLDSFMNQFISILKEKQSSRATRRTNTAQSYQSSRPRPRPTTDSIAAVGGSNVPDQVSVRAPTQYSNVPDQVSVRAPTQYSNVPDQASVRAPTQYSNVPPMQTTASIRTSRSNVNSTNFAPEQVAPWSETPNNTTNEHVAQDELASVTSAQPPLPQDSMLIRGHGRLLRRMNQVETAIDAEQELYEQNQHQNLEHLVEESHQSPETSEDNTYDERSTVDEEQQQTQQL